MPVAGVSQMASVSGCALLHPALQGSLGRLQLASSCLLGGGGLSNTGFLMPGVRARPPSQQGPFPLLHRSLGQAPRPHPGRGQLHRVRAA
jgi:hypothetical protein